ncbi:UNVERIFIED_CONTAM: Retrovirus-related Pol polyprotein from transposon RE1 [Sesamum radiatum]|uniref:Retrovirus-related Pol polyprotein from transposon RE1 n=1 Tax=Sesamum radiatum TaxID=300843 RepID=A0AAW2P817_SESRA
MERSNEHELTALEKNHTWELTTLPEGKRAIGSKWVYKVKLNPDGTVERYKARLVAKGYNQIEGVDFFDSFSPVAKTVTVRIMFSIASAYSWPIHQLDINNAFLHGYLDEAVYMTPPEGYEAPSGMLMVFWLCLFVDDVLITGTSDTLIQNVKSYLDRGSFTEPDRYRRLIGKFLYLGFTRPDISFAVQQLSQFLQHPTQQHWDAAIHVVRYLKGSSSMALFFPSQNSLQLSAFSDADWATCVDSRRRSIVPWPLLSVNFYGSLIFLKIFKFLLPHLFHSGVITKRPSISLPIQCFMNGRNTLTSIVTLFGINIKRVYFSPYIAGHLQPADAFTKILPVAAFTQSSVKLGLVSLPHAPT